MKFITGIQYLVLALTYLGLALGKIPGLRMNRATISLVGSAFLITLGILTLEEAWQAIDANTVIFLLSMMVVNANLAYSGFFQLFLNRLIRITHTPFGLLVVLTLSCGWLSALFLNDTIALVFTPLILSLTQTLSLNPIPYLLALGAATNIGSVATINGNPQNILIGSFSQIPFLEFAQILTPVAILGLMVQIALLWLFYPDVRSLKPLVIPPRIRVKMVRPLLIKTVVITSGLFVAFIAGYPLGISALTAVALLLMTRRIKPEKILKQVDWDLLVMFSGLFILTAATERLNLLQIFTPFAETTAGLLGVTVILSNLISNVPAVLMMQPLINPQDTKSWLILAAASTLAGNLTLFGSVANLIIVESAAKLRYKITFIDHLKFGVPVTLITLLIAYFWIELTVAL
ncbi:anion transporter [Planktothrix sp. FACHB-1365]|uniref:anion transporter n=1 Tax=Planktothrix sp. FACHB-1365 TaxID=2692855 RepID=UPI002814B3C5|nr:anion transporter [Planktothrix sp. FACHB-1365]